MKKPWEIRNELTAERIGVVAAVIVNARDKAADARIFYKGDNPWVHGCRAYSWAGTALQKTAASHDWLDASMSMNIFTGNIGEVPFTISRDDPNEVCERTRKKMSRLPDHESDVQLDLGFEHIWIDEQVRFCFVINADATDVFGVSLVGVVNTGLIVARHDINIAEAVKTLIDLEISAEPPDEVSAYEPSFKEEIEPTKNNDNVKAGGLDAQGNDGGGSQ